VKAPDLATYAAIVHLYRYEELSMEAVSAKTGETVGRVRDVLQREGIVRRRAVIVPPGKVAAIVQACNEDGMTLADAGARYGVSRIVAGRVLREHGAGLQPAEAAAIAGITPGELRRLAATGGVRYVTSPADNGRYRYFLGEMEALRLVEALRWTFAEIYSVTVCEGGKLQAHRRDFTRTVYADTPAGLRRAIMEDYGHHPVTFP
jgi:hypothetical protein